MLQALQILKPLLQLTGSICDTAGDLAKEAVIEAMTIMGDWLSFMTFGMAKWRPCVYEMLQSRNATFNSDSTFLAFDLVNDALSCFKIMYDVSQHPSGVTILYLVLIFLGCRH